MTKSMMKAPKNPKKGILRVHVMNASRWESQRKGIAIQVTVEREGDTFALEAGGVSRTIAALGVSHEVTVVLVVPSDLTSAEVTKVTDMFVALLGNWRAGHHIFLIRAPGAFGGAKKSKEKSTVQVPKPEETGKDSSPPSPIDSAAVERAVDRYTDAIRSALLDDDTPDEGAPAKAPTSPVAPIIQRWYPDPLTLEDAAAAEDGAGEGVARAQRWISPPHYPLGALTSAQPGLRVTRRFAHLAGTTRPRQGTHFGVEGGALVGLAYRTTGLDPTKLKGAKQDGFTSDDLMRIFGGEGIIAPVICSGHPTATQTLSPMKRETTLTRTANAAIYVGVEPRSGHLPESEDRMPTTPIIDQSDTLAPGFPRGTQAADALGMPQPEISFSEIDEPPRRHHE